MSTLPQTVPVTRTIRLRAARARTVFVLALALCSRLVVAWYTLVHLPAGWLFTRGIEMDSLAKSLLAGKGLSSPFGPATGPTAMIAPAYPIFLAGVFRLFGIDSIASAAVVFGVHIALNVLTAWLILDLGRRLAGERAAAVMAAVWACSFPVIWMPAILWETSFSTCFLLGAVAMALRATPESGARQWIGGGAGCAVAGLFNPALLPSLLALGAWTAYKNKGGENWTGSWRKPAFALAAFLLVFSPWPIRNARVFHAFIPTRSVSGLALWMGNRPGGTGFLDESFFPAYNAGELVDYKQRGELAYVAHKGDLAKEYIQAHSARFARTSLLRAERFWSGTGNRHGTVLLAVHATVTTLLGVMGLVFPTRSRERETMPFFLIPLVLFPLPYCFTFAEFRYRLVVDPLLCVLAARALRQLAHQSFARPGKPT